MESDILGFYRKDRAFWWLTEFDDRRSADFFFYIWGFRPPAYSVGPILADRQRLGRGLYKATTA